MRRYRGLTYPALLAFMLFAAACDDLGGGGKGTAATTTTVTAPSTTTTTSTSTTSSTTSTTTTTLPLAFVGHGYSPDDLEVIDLNAMQNVATITGAGGYRVVTTPDGRKLYSTGGDSLVYVSDAVGRTLITSFDPAAGTAENTPSELEAIAISPDGSRVYVMDEQGFAGLFVIDTSTDTVVASTSALTDPDWLFDEPENAVVSPDGRFLFVVDNTDLVKIDLQTLAIVGRVGVASDAHGVAINPAGTRVYADSESGGIGVFDAADLTEITNVGTGFGLAYFIEHAKGENRVYAVDEGSTLTVIDTGTNTLVDSIDVGSCCARGVTTTAGGAHVVVATSGGLVLLDAQTFEILGTVAGSFQSVVVPPPAG